MTETPLLEVEDLHITYRTDDDDVRAVTDASFEIEAGEYFGLVGESGSGKSTIAKALVGGLDDNAEIVSGTIRFDGTEIQSFDEGQFNEHVRWDEVSLIPQASMDSLDPVMRISEQAVELARRHTDWSEETTVDRFTDLFDVVGLPEARIHDYPHQFSGGMEQRALIALALLLEPSLVIADEPTTALDVIMQDQILGYLEQLREERDLSMLLITHDISVVFETCDSMAVLHGGQVAERGTTETLFDRPKHPYTHLLQQSFPDIRSPGRELETIGGSPPQLLSDVDHCTFADRCPWAKEECRAESPPLEPAGDDQYSSCIRNDELTDWNRPDGSTGMGTPDGEPAQSTGSDHTESTDGELTRATGSESGQSVDGEPAQSTDGEPVASPDRPDAVGRATGDGRLAGHAGESDALLDIRGLEKHFSQGSGLLDSVRQAVLGESDPPVRAVDGVDLSLQPNQVQGVIGESGCGKSTLLNLLMGLLSPTGGTVEFDGCDVSTFDSAGWQEFRRRVQVVFQDPYNAIDPKLRVRESLREPLQVHDIDDQERRIERALRDVQLTPPEKFLDRFPGRLSGGEKQRVSIARALVLDPDVLLADEPVSMLDVSTQAAILGLLDDLSEQRGLSMLYVSHDLSTVSYICDRVNVMYLGRIVETGPTAHLLESPKHPYTEQLVKAIPVPDPHHVRDRTDLRGTPSDPTDLPGGCRFKDRCPERMDACDRRPEYVPVEAGADHFAACHLYGDEADPDGARGHPADEEGSTGTLSSEPLPHGGDRA